MHSLSQIHCLDQSRPRVKLKATKSFDKANESLKKIWNNRTNATIKQMYIYILKHNAEMRLINQTI